jgi:hypothetical protein
VSNTIVENVRSGIEAYIGSLFPSKAASPYQYDLDRNAYKKNENLYCVRAGSFDQVAGTNRTLTVDQEFEAIFSTSFANKAGGDASLQSKIQTLWSDVMELARTAAGSKVGQPNRVMLVSNVRADAPDIDEDNFVVSITLTMTVKYRTEA